MRHGDLGAWSEDGAAARMSTVDHPVPPVQSRDLAL